MGGTFVKGEKLASDISTVSFATTGSSFALGLFLLCT